MANVYNSLMISLKRLAISRCHLHEPLRYMHHSGALLFRATESLNAEPMKKKKKVDMSVILGREMKKRRKIEKAIRKQESKGLKLKPIEEIEGDRSVLKTLDKRKRQLEPINFDESERRATLLKSWTRYSVAQFRSEWMNVECLMQEQSRALMELRRESEQLYQQAIEIDDQLLPYKYQGPVETPPIKDYNAPDGDYIDTTRKFDK